MHVAPMTLFLVACNAVPPGADTSSGLVPIVVPGTAAWPDAADGSLSIVTGIDEGLGWGNARSIFPFDITAVRDAFANPDAVVDRREIDTWTVDMDVTDDPVSFTLHDETTDMGVTVEFDVTWRMGAVRGSEDSPAEEVARFDKTAGTAFIDVLQGSVDLVADGEQTRIELVQQLDATLGGEDERIAAYLADLNASVWAVCNGEPLPTYD